MPLSGFSQSAGDVAFTGFNGEGSASDDGFAVVLFTSYSEGDEIHFSSMEWDGSAFVGAGGDFTWVAPIGGTSAGTVLVFEDVEGTPSVNIGSIADDVDMNLSGSGDVIYAYTGVDKDTPGTPFLGAIATDANLYNQPDGTEGTLANTGLIQAGNETILLPDDIDNAEYIGSRSGNTPNGYRNQLNIINGEDSNNDNWDIFNGNDVAPFPPFNDQSFTIVNPPTLRFTNSLIARPEGDTAPLTVELTEANGTAVSVDVVFLSGSSEADVSDINGFTSQTVNFAASDNSGTPRTVTVNVTNDNNFEGNEIAVFRLQNNTAGSIIEPGINNLNIIDDDAPGIVFNEINADPGDDANGDGVVGDANSDEFIEWVNNSGQDIDISGWTYADSNSDRFTFPEGSVIGAGNAVVLFDNDGGTVQPRGNFGAAYVFTDTEIGLNNTSETLTLSDDFGNTITTATYDNEASGESNNLNPDGTGTTYVDHSTLSGGSLSSPGTQVDGSIWGAGTFAVAFRGVEGYRFVSSPAQTTTFDDLFAGLWTQGITGSNVPSATGSTNIFSWQESGVTFAPPGNMSDELVPGRGYIVYTFEDDDFSVPGIQGGFPKVINTNNAENTSPVSVAVSANDQNGSTDIDGNEGFNLLGNPYGADILVDAVIAALRNVDQSINANISIWDAEEGGGNGGYITLSEGDGERIAPFQAFFVRYTQQVNDNVSFDRSALVANAGTPFFGQPKETQPEVNFEIYLDDGNKFDTYEVEFKENGTIGEDLLDAYKLFSLNPDAISFYSKIGDDVKLAKNVLPAVEALEDEGELRVSLGYDVPQSGSYTIRWSDLQDIPQQLELYLADNETGQKIDMKKLEEYEFNISIKKEQTAVQQTLSPSLSKTDEVNNSTRFELLVVSSSEKVDENTEEPLEEAVVLSTNYPNPFNSQTTMDLQLREKMDVNVTVWNIVGQKVATMIDRQMDAGPHPMTWNVPANMPSGIYICKVEAGGMVLTRKMTLVK